MRHHMSLPGQQTRVLLQGPDHSLPIVGTVRCRSVEGLGDHVTIGPGATAVIRSWTTVTGLRSSFRAHRTARQAIAVPEFDTSDVAAGGALGGLLPADRAVPVLALALEGSQLLAGLSSDRGEVTEALALRAR